MIALLNFSVAIASISGGYCLGMIVAILIERYHTEKAKKEEMLKKLEKLLDKTEEK